MDEALQELQSAIGKRGVIRSVEDMARYLADLQGGLPVVPIAVFRPSTTQEAAIVVKWCRKHDVMVIPQGGLTGLTTAAVPTKAGKTAIIALDRMNAIRDIDALNNTVTVDAGVVLADLQAAAVAEERYFPLSHGAQGSSQIGGNLSTNSGGNNTIRYGTARDQVLGPEVVLPDGTVWNGLRQLRKNTAGYDLKQLFIGAEGTMGLITGAVLKLRPYPHNRVSAFVSVESSGAALRLLRSLETYVGETIAAFELMSASAVEFALTMEGARYPLQHLAQWNVLIEVETPSHHLDLATAFEAALAAAIECGDVEDAVISQSVAQRNSFWHLRESIAMAFVEDKDCVKGDTAVPVGRVAAYIERTLEAVAQCVPGARAAHFGHLGDGNIHFNVARPAEMDGAEFRTHWDAIKSLTEQEALKLGGTISAEHGIGTLKLAAFEAAIDPIEKDIMQKLRRSIDPQRRMNPNVLV